MNIKDQPAQASGDSEEAVRGCPFCGATPHQGLTKVEHDQLHGEPFQRFRFCCPHGHAEIIGNDRSRALAQWNTRATLAAAPAAEGVREALLKLIDDAQAHIDELDHAAVVEAVEPLAKAIYVAWMKDERWQRLDLATIAQGKPMAFFWAEVAARTALSQSKAPQAGGGQ